MSAARLFILVIAAVAAIVLAFVVRGAFAPKTAEPVAVAAAPAAAKAMTRVLVAKRDLPIGTRLAVADMGWQDWPADALNSAYVTDGAPPTVKATGAKGAVKEATTAASSAVFGEPAMQGFVDAVVREPILAGEPIMARKIVKAGEGNYMSIVLMPGHRAAALPITTDSAAGGFIMPGDRVDLLFSKNNDPDKGGVVTRTVLRNIRVLAIDQVAEAAADAKSLVGAVATVEVASGDTEFLAAAQAEAKAGGFLSLVLRSYADAGGPSGRGSSSGGKQGVRVHRAGQVSEVMAPQ